MREPSCTAFKKHYQVAFLMKSNFYQNNDNSKTGSNGTQAIYSNITSLNVFCPLHHEEVSVPRQPVASPAFPLFPSMATWVSKTLSFL